MKKIVVMAGAMLPFAALAQSSVTVYGMLDTSIVSYNYSAAGTRPRSQLTVLASDASRLGFRGTEDLGGGLRAYFRLEHGMQSDTGEQTDPLAFWSREAYVGLGGNQLGSVQLGRQYTPNLWMSIRTDPFTRFGVGGQPTLTQGVRGYPLQYSNAVQYISPTVANTTFRMLVSAGEGAPTGKSVSAGIDHASGPLYLGLVYDQLKVVAAAVGLSGAPVESSTLAIGASYDFGVFKVQGHLQSNRTEQLDDVRVYLLGLVIPVGVGELKASYSYRTGEGETGARLMAVGYQYFLSKRTSLLANIAKLDNQANASFRMGPARTEQLSQRLPGAGQDTTGIQFGIRHWF